MNYYLEGMPDVNKSIERVYAWYEQKLLDRAPIRFNEHNARHAVDVKDVVKKYKDIKDFWLDTEYQVQIYLDSLKGKQIFAETFPVYYPNLGPSVYAAYYGVPLVFSEVTSWSEHILHDLDSFEIENLKINKSSEYWLKIEEMTDYALRVGEGIFFTGYTDLHPSFDCVADFMGPEALFMAMYDCPEKVQALAQKVCADFSDVFKHYHQKLKKMPSVTWMGIPTEEPMHIPSCDVSSMLSTNQFEEFCLPYILEEIMLAKYNIFHLDGSGVMRHIDAILGIKEIQAIQWVQGPGDEEPIGQWIPLIKKIQNAGKSVAVGLKPDELKLFMSEVSPRGIYLTMAADYEDQADLVKLVEQWR